ncbi:MAG TPA: hypothetical protein VKP30_33860 [Polyangiaceae bacterium]|nr:hypothetical protein [Polyangiaceae bacterium]
MAFHIAIADTHRLLSTLGVGNPDIPREAWRATAYQMAPEAEMVIFGRHLSE